MPAAVLPATMPFSGRPSVMLLTFDPAPQPGQPLRVTGQACVPYDSEFLDDPDYVYDPTGCDVDLTITIGAPVESRGVAPSEVELLVRDHTIDDPSRIPGCGDPPDRTYDVSAVVDRLPAAPAFLTVRIEHPDDLELAVEQTVSVSQPGELSVSLRDWAPGPGNDPCMELTMWDVTGVAGPTVRSCGVASCVLEDYDGGRRGACGDSGCRVAATHPNALALLALLALARRRRGGS
jgi:hypothetical protein